MKINPAGKIETIKVILSEKKYPAAYAAKMEELTNPQYGCGLSENMARKFLKETPIVLELYYQTGYGLFAVEGEALDADPNSVISPYTGEPLEDPEDQSADACHTIVVMRTKLITQIKELLRRYGLDSIMASDIDAGNSPVVQADHIDANNTCTLDSIEIDKEGKLSVSASSCFHNIDFDETDIPTDVLADICDWLKENEDTLRELSTSDD